MLLELLELCEASKQEYKCPKRVGSPRAVVAGCFELSSIDTGKQTQVFWNAFITAESSLQAQGRGQEEEQNPTS